MNFWMGWKLLHQIRDFMMHKINGTKSWNGPTGHYVTKLQGCQTLSRCEETQQKDTEGSLLMPDVLNQKSFFLVEAEQKLTIYELTIYDNRHYNTAPLWEYVFPQPCYIDDAGMNIAWYEGIELLKNAIYLWYRGGKLRNEWKFLCFLQVMTWNQMLTVWNVLKGFSCFSFWPWQKITNNSKILRFSIPKQLLLFYQ